MHVLATEQMINKVAEKFDLSQCVWKADRLKKKKKKRKKKNMILMLTSLIYKLGDQAAFSHIHTRLCTYTHGFNVIAGKTEHLRPIRPPGL